MREESICHTVRLLAVAPFNDLSPSEYEQLQQHLAICIECANMQREYEALRMRIRYAAAQEPVPDFSTLQLFNPRPRQKSFARRAILVAGLAASVTALEGSALWMFLRGPLAPSPHCVSFRGQMASAGLLRPGVLSWGADPGSGLAHSSDAAPYVFLDRNGEPVGFEVEIANALAYLLGIIPYCHTTTSYENLDDPLQLGQIDIILNGWEVTQDHLRDEVFSVPYYRYSQQLVVRANDSRFSQYGPNSLITLTDVDRYTFGTGTGYKSVELLQKAGIMPITSETPITDLDNRRVDVIMIDTPIVAYYVQGKGVGATPSHTLRPIGQPLFADSESDYVIAFKANDPQADTLRQEIDQALNILKQNGKLKDIYQRWGLWNDFQKDIGIIDPPTICS